MTDTKDLFSILDNTRVVIPQKHIESRIDRLREILERRIHEAAPPVTILVLGKGGHIFAQHLLLGVRFDCEVHYMYTSTYNAANEVGEFSVNYTTAPDFKGRYVIVLDDIYDTGTTQVEVQRLCVQQEAVGFEAMVLLSKPERHQHKVPLLGVGFEIPDIFVYGWGMDAYGFDALRRKSDVCCITENLPRKGALFTIPVSS